MSESTVKMVAGTVTVMIAIAVGYGVSFLIREGVPSGIRVVVGTVLNSIK